MCRASTKNSHATLTQLPLMLTSYLAPVPPSKLGHRHCYIIMITMDFILTSPVSPLMSFCLFQDPMLSTNTFSTTTQEMSQDN